MVHDYFCTLWSLLVSDRMTFWKQQQNTNVQISGIFDQLCIYTVSGKKTVPIDFVQ